MNVTGPFYYSEWEYRSSAPCKPKRIILLGEVHRKPECSADGEKIAVEDFLYRIVRSKENQDRFTMDIFLETRYVRAAEKKTHPRGKAVLPYTPDEQDRQSKIFKIQEKFKQKLTTTKRRQNYRIHYIDYRHNTDLINTNAVWDVINECHDYSIQFTDPPVTELRTIFAVFRNAVSRIPDRWFTDMGNAVWNDRRIQKQYASLTESERKKIGDAIHGLYRDLQDRCDRYKRMVARIVPSHDALLRDAIHRFGSGLLFCHLNAENHIMDVYALGRILRCFREQQQKPSLMFVYAGALHTQTYAQVFASMGLTPLANVEKDPKEQCINTESMVFLRQMTVEYKKTKKTKRRQQQTPNVSKRRRV